MITNRELLELAAKAAGLILDSTGWEHENLTVLAGDGGWRRWNPLTDDGDALRLAAKLKIDIEWQATQLHALPLVEAYQSNIDGGCYCACENESDYRLAIVIAAAEIGKAMP